MKSLGIRFLLFIRSLTRINNEVLGFKPDNEIARSVEIILSEYNEELSAISLSQLINNISEVILTGTGTLKLRDYFKAVGDQLAEEKVFIEEFYQEFKKLSFEGDFQSSTSELIDISRKLLKLMDEIEDRYSEKKESRGYLDFEDILLFAMRLTSNEEITEELGEKYKYIMIDEYQDTNDIQYNIFMPVLKNLDRGNLFVVGDEKQSIYMFRDADIGIYQQTQDDMSATEEKGKVISLPHSFRMYKGVAAFTNKLFRNLFENPQPLYGEVSYSELICGKDSDEPGSVEFLVADKESIAEKELLARRIISLYNKKNIDSGFNFGDIAVLCRKRSNFSELEEVFNNYKIPFLVVGGKGFYQQQVILDIYNYLSFIVDSNNDLALLGVLRSPFFLMSDANIYELSTYNGHTLFKKLGQYIQDKKYFSNSYELLKEHIRISASYEISQLIKIILKDTGYWKLVSVKEDTEQKIKKY